MTRQLLPAVCAALFLAGGGPAVAAAQGPEAMTGGVTSAEEGAMEGVVVSAKKAGSTVTTSVVTDSRGRFSFPSSKLGSGDYVLRIRATGYELEAPVSVDVVLALAREVDLKLRKVRDISPPMTNAEWTVSFPGCPDQSKFPNACVRCHTLERLAKS